MESEGNYAETAMLIRKPIAKVFDAFIHPEITTKFWFTKSSGKLEEGKTIDWTWEMFDHTASIYVISIIPNEKIIIQWGSDKEAIAEWIFKSMGANKTFITITNTGLRGTTNEIMAQIRDATGGFSWVLAGAKAYLEHDLELNLIADRYPKEE
ncbi:MAG: SRPBCC family protein [Maribacter sp.]|uniref:SRPBCC family protein n=1 Tax=Maribacter sp. TaxID=1897614 RepID=UPI0032983EF6